MSVTTTCERIGCDKAGAASPTLLLRPTGRPDWPDPIRIEFALVVCAEHQPEITAADLISDEGWQMIVGTVRRFLPGAVEPDRKGAEIKWAWRQ